VEKRVKGWELNAVLMFRGYIDESYDPNPIPQVFTLSCIIGFDNMLPWFEMAWAKVLEEKNQQLKEQSRPPISRYHASNCSSLHGEFAGWSVDEQIEFSLKLFNVFRNHPIHIHAFDMPLQLLVQEIPETTENPVGFAYVILLFYLMQQISENTLSLYPDDQIRLHHDRCDYDGALADAFGQVLDDPTFKRANQYASITPADWQNCVMLQPADLIAYENFKEGMQHYYPNPKIKGRRKSLEAILDIDDIGARASGLGVDVIRQLKIQIDALDKKGRKRLFDAARIRA
jgi:hypothetical protein